MASGSGCPNGPQAFLSLAAGVGPPEWDWGNWISHNIQEGIVAWTVGSDS